MSYFDLYMDIFSPRKYNDTKNHNGWNQKNITLPKHILIERKPPIFSIPMLKYRSRNYLYSNK